MNDELQAKFIEWIEKLTSGATAEIPEFIREAAMVGFLENLITAAFSLAFILIASCFSLYFFKNIPEPEKSWETPIYFRKLILIGGTISFLSFPAYVMLDTTKDAIKARCAPKIYVIEKYVFMKR